jgi:hypothetical protein
MVAYFIYTFVVPEVQKLICKHMKQRHVKYLQEANDLMYVQSEKLPPVDHLMMHPVSTG